MRTVAHVAGLEKLSNADRLGLAHAADRIGTTTTSLATCEGFESGFDPKVPNRAGSGARGVIQFMPKTMCALLGMPDNDDTRKLATARFEAMSFVEQQEFVVKYFAWFPGHDFSTLEALYCAIFYPAAINKPDDWTLPPGVYRQNAGFDLAGNRDGKITKGEICAAIRKFRATADGKPDLEIQEPGDEALALTDDEKREFLNLVLKTSSQATEEFRAGSPLPDDVHLIEDTAPATQPNPA